MPDEDKQERRPIDNNNPGGGDRPVDQALSSKRLKPKDRLDKNKGHKPAGDPRSGSESNQSSSTRGH